jgi:hypothetical protein
MINLSLYEKKRDEGDLDYLVNGTFGQAGLDMILKKLYVYM